MIYFPLNNTAFYHGLPADCDGTFPPSGTPEYFAWTSTTHMNFYEFHVDWTTPSNSTFTESQMLSITPFTFFGYGVGLPQPGTTVKIDPLSYPGSIMNRMQFRVFSDHWSMLTNSTVDIGSNVAGIRWYEFRRDAINPWSVYQMATYAPSDGNSRWNGSIAMDSSGNIALAYSITSSSLYPSIRYTGRVSCDPLNQFTIAESGIMNGSGSQTNTWSGSPSRWGDYSALNIDPSSAKTFWYTNEYYATTSQANWKTRIASFSFANILDITATATPSNICIGQNSQLDAVPTGGSGIYTYSWTSIPSGFTSNLPNPVATPVINTQYIVAVNDGNLTKRDTVTVTVNQEPTAFAGNNATYPNTVPLFPAAGTASNYSSVKWFTDGDGHFNIDTVPASLYYPGTADKNNGGVDLTLKAYPLGTCADTASSTVHITLSFPQGIGTHSSGVFGFTITPNPSNGNFSLIIDGIANSVASITVTDITGREIVSEKGVSIGLAKEISLAGYPKGTYFIRVSTDQQSAIKKLVLQ